MRDKKHPRYTHLKANLIDKCKKTRTRQHFIDKFA